MGRNKKFAGQTFSDSSHDPRRLKRFKVFFGIHYLQTVWAESEEAAKKAIRIEKVSK
jgi:hypothetical protein